MNQEFINQDFIDDLEGTLREEEWHWSSMPPLEDNNTLNFKELLKALAVLTSRIERDAKNFLEKKISSLINEGNFLEAKKLLRENTLNDSSLRKYLSHIIHDAQESTTYGRLFYLIEEWLVDRVVLTKSYPKDSTGTLLFIKTVDQFNAVNTLKDDLEVEYKIDYEEFKKIYDSRKCDNPKQARCFVDIIEKYRNYPVIKEKLDGPKICRSI